MALSQDFKEIRTSRYFFEGRVEVPLRWEDSPCVTIDMDCGRMKDVGSLYEEFARKFYFPDYFSFNLDSFDECVNDVFLPKDSSYYVVYGDSCKFLVDADVNTRQAIDEILYEMLETWNSPSNQDQPWGRSAVNLIFHFI